MGSQVTMKVRFVICPKCRQLLFELPDLGVYKCGGCDTTLQGEVPTYAHETNGIREYKFLTILVLLAAKHKKDDKKCTKSSPAETVSSQSPELVNSFQDKKALRNSSQRLLLPSAYELSSSHNSEIDNDDSGNNTEQPIVSKEICSFTELTSHENEEISPQDGISGKANEAEEADSNFSIPNTNNLPARRISSPHVTTLMQTHEYIPPHTSETPFSEQEQFNVRSLGNFDGLRSANAEETSDVIFPGSELSMHGDLPKSPTTRSSRAYDGSVSSCDGTDDHVPDQYPQTSTRALLNSHDSSDFVVSEQTPSIEKIIPKGTVRSNLEMQKARSFLSAESSSRYLQAKQKPMKQEHPIRLARSEHSSVLSHLRGSCTRCENGSTSKHGHACYKQRYLVSDKHQYSEQDKMELLNIVCELRDQLCRTRNQIGKENGRVHLMSSWKDKDCPTFCGCEAANARQTHHNLYYSDCLRRCRGGKSGSQQCLLSQIPFSQGCMDKEQQFDYSCFHCHPQEWPYAVQMPPFVCYSQGLYRACPGCKCHRTYCFASAHPSPQHSISPFPSCGRDRAPGDQRRKDHEMKKLHMREISLHAKRHLRPIAGGSPLISCHNCSKLLQLPADFLLFKRRCHHLKCGACSEVLKFSLENQTHVAPYTPHITATPPTEVDNNGAAIGGRNPSSSSGCSHGDPVSCSDYSGLSFSKSCSTEGGPIYLTSSSNAAHGEVNYKMAQFSSSSEPMGETKKHALKQSQSSYNRTFETYKTETEDKKLVKQNEHTGASSRMLKLSEVDQLRPMSTSPLHRLMGYSSPGALIYGSGAGRSTDSLEENKGIGNSLRP
ncbi:putative zinc-ribbon domain, plant [Dillenia turbinata]|uniref:Zinc-ribbon domain, plant n=1 Tax=Dillenia turbinata TaxID=194707 RepID=A0AAN8ZC68_9MAGN